MSQEPWSGTVVWPVLHDREKVKERWDDWANRSLHPSNYRADARFPFALALVHGETGQILKTRVLVPQADKRSDDGDLVHRCCRSRQEFADLYPGHGSGNWLEFAANPVRSFRLQVERILVCQTSCEIYHDHRLMRLRRASVSRLCLCLKQVGKAKPAHRQSTDLQERTARQAVAIRS